MQLDEGNIDFKLTKVYYLKMENRPAEGPWLVTGK